MALVTDTAKPGQPWAHGWFGAVGKDELDLRMAHPGQVAKIERTRSRFAEAVG
jgi:hypothetical protein